MRIRFVSRSLEVMQGNTFILNKMGGCLIILLNRQIMHTFIEKYIFCFYLSNMPNINLTVTRKCIQLRINTIRRYVQ